MLQSDRRLVERARRGDRDAFDALARRYLDAAYAVALAVLREPADAEDAAQDALVTALERLDECRQPDRFRGWLLTIVRNTAKNRLRSLTLRAGVPVEDAGLASEARDADPASYTETGRLRERLLAALDTLDPVRREVVLLHDLEGWKHREIGAALGLPEGTVRSHLSLARKALRERLGKEAR